MINFCIGTKKGVYNIMKTLKIIYATFLLFPLINLLTGLMTRYINFPLTIGVIIRIALLLFLVMYVFFLSKSKYKKMTIIYFVTIAIFAIGYFITKPEYFNLRSIYNECNTMFKFMYFPVLLFGMINLCDEYGFDEKKWQKNLLFGLIFYVIFIILPIILQSSFNSYVREENGLVGWFYAANEVGPILLMLYPTTFMLLDKHKIWFLIISTLSIFSALAISTKVITLGLGIVIFAYILFYLIFNRKKYINKLFLMIIAAVYIILYSPIGDTLYWNLERYNSNEPPIIIDKDPDKSDDINIPNNDNSEPTESLNDFLTILLSNRNTRVLEINDIYINSDGINKLFGIGFYDIEKQENHIIEMDFLDIFYHYGIIGFLVLIFPYLFLSVNFIKSIKNKLFKLDLKSCYSILLFLLFLGISFVAGHVISAPAVSTFLTVYFLYIFTLIKPQPEQ